MKKIFLPITAFLSLSVFAIMYSSVAFAGAHYACSNVCGGACQEWGQPNGFVNYFGSCGNNCNNGDTSSTGSCNSGCSSYVQCYQNWFGLASPCVTMTSCSSYCSYTACSAGTADCNKNPNDRCEVTLNTDANNCGSCGNVCGSGQTCQSGVCTTPTDFSVTLSPTSGLVNAGDSKVSNVSVNLTAGSSLPVTFSVTGLPTGASASFSPTSCSPNCYSNMTISTTGATPVGSTIVSVKGTSGSVVRTVTYNLTVLSSSCNSNNVCEYPETQASCASDCKTTATMSSPVSPGDIATVSVEFFDSRYQANDKVKIDLNIDGTSPWTSTNGCFFGGVKLGPSAGGDGTIAWPSGTISTDGHFKITTSCQVPSTITAGAHTLVATPTII